MGLSFHDEESMVEAATTLRFQVVSDESDNSNSISFGSVVHGRDSDSKESNDDDVPNIQGKDIDIDSTVQ